MAIDFPNSPTIGDEFTGGGFTWTWTGSAWEKLSASAALDSTRLFVRVPTANTYYRASVSGLSMGPAVRIKAFAQDMNSTPIAEVKVQNGGTVLSFLATKDGFSSDTYNYSEISGIFPTDATDVYVSMSVAGFITIENIAAAPEATTSTVTTYLTSQNITVSVPSGFALIGGGGGGGTAPPGFNNRGGGGSGYTAGGTLQPGTYSLVIGTGGAAGQTGGSTTLNGVTALGGQGSNSFAGGAGGSGGGQGQDLGGILGNKGNGNSGGAGSGIVPGGFVSGLSLVQAPLSSGGGLYGGGAGGRTYFGGGSANGRGGGGGGGGSSNDTSGGGTGGAGVAYVWSL